MSRVFRQAARQPRVWTDRVAALFALLVLGLAARLTLFLRQRGDAAFTDVDAAAAAEIGIVLLTLLVLAVSGARLTRAVRAIARRSSGLWVLYFGLGILTSLQSLHVSFSLFRAVEGFSQALAMAFIVAAMPTFRAAESAVLGIAWCTLALDFVGRVKLGGFALGELASNSYSASAAMIACYSWGEALEARGPRRTRMWISTALALGFVVMGLSLASWWAALGGLMLAGLVLRPSLPVVILLLTLLLLVIGIGPDVVDALLLRNRPVTEISTFHGRLLLWQFYWEAFLQRPWLGYGFAMGARMNADIYTTHTHNAILSALLGLGIPGFALQLGALVCYAREVIWSRLRGTPGWVGCTAALTCAGINSMAFALVGEGWMPSTIVFAAFLMLHGIHVARRAPSVPPPARVTAP